MPGTFTSRTLNPKCNLLPYVIYDYEFIIYYPFPWYINFGILLCHIASLTSWVLSIMRHEEVDLDKIIPISILHLFMAGNSNEPYYSTVMAWIITFPHEDIIVLHGTFTSTSPPPNNISTQSSSPYWIINTTCLLQSADNLTAVSIIVLKYLKKKALQDYMYSVQHVTKILRMVCAFL